MKEFDARLKEVVDRFGTPSYVYFTEAIDSRIADIQAAFGKRFALSYAVKCNPNPGLLKWLSQRIEFVDVSSIGEFRLAKHAGWGPAQASFTGPGKREVEIAEAIENDIGELIIENVREAKIANKVAGEFGRRQNVLIRLAPSFVPKGFGDHMAGRPSPFGIDVEEAREQVPEIVALPNLSVIGFHIYSGTQCLNPEAVCENYRVFLSVFREVCQLNNIVPQKLIFGSGLGIPYHHGDTPLNLEDIADGICTEIEEFCAEARFSDTRLILELGRYLVGEAGFFLTSVVNIKESRGQRIAICDGGMNNHLPASGHFGMVIHRNYKMHVLGESGDAEKVNLVGPLCTSIDRLGNAVSLPRLNEGDVVALHCSGAYGLTASPINFISHPHPNEVLFEKSNIVDVTRDGFTDRY
ncbi:diaminopimelate decarboxylase [Ruegeria halocynthiae]|uniref:Diaminopimelate decarboxylase n=1 Tax=Ruegeria halocynthiae TaxID=985054 RepID=A0A1H3E0U6_9RHOB|nr:decarboxylase [Ruegeria halocynthiae]SDX72240.1 diaminopimelate decarboxylase [Ruegeria halocynthiae]